MFQHATTREDDTQVDHLHDCPWLVKHKSTMLIEAHVKRIRVKKALKGQRARILRRLDFNVEPA